MRVQVLERVDDLERVALHLQLVQPLSPPQQLVQALVCAQFQQDVHVLSVFEKVLEFDHVLVVHRPMDLNLTHEFLFGPALGERGLNDNLGRAEYLSFLVDKFIAFGESALPQELAFEIFADLHFSVVLHNFFFDYYWCTAFHL